MPHTHTHILQGAMCEARSSRLSATSLFANPLVRTVPIDGIPWRKNNMMLTWNVPWQFGLDLHEIWKGWKQLFNVKSWLKQMLKMQAAGEDEFVSLMVFFSHNPIPASPMKVWSSLTDPQNSGFKCYLKWFFLHQVLRSLCVFCSAGENHSVARVGFQEGKCKG